MSVEIIPRAEWGAAKPRRRTMLPPDRLAGVAVHWFGSPVAARSHDECPALLRSVQQGHLSNTKENYSDIAYNHAVCPHGSAYELRGFGVFQVKPRKRGIGRNPRTGKEVRIPPGRTIRFKPGKDLQNIG